MHRCGTLNCTYMYLTFRAVALDSALLAIVLNDSYQSYSTTIDQLSVGYGYHVGRASTWDGGRGHIQGHSSKAKRANLW